MSPLLWAMDKYDLVLQVKNDTSGTGATRGRWACNNYSKYRISKMYMEVRILICGERSKKRSARFDLLTSLVVGDQLSVVRRPLSYSKSGVVIRLVRVVFAGEAERSCYIFHQVLRPSQS